MTVESNYKLPEQSLGLTGPVAKPEPGSLPLRGDLAHIALAGTHLAAHYVVPHLRKTGVGGARLMLLPSDDASVSADIGPDESLEILDLLGDWCWACRGPAGPSGYVPISQLQPADMA